MLRTCLVLLALLASGCTGPAGSDGDGAAPGGGPAQGGEPTEAAPPERLGLEDVLPLLDGNVTWLLADLQNGTAQRWDAGGVRNGSEVTWQVFAAGASVPRLPLPPVEYPNRTVVERVGGPAVVDAVPVSAVPPVPADARDAAVWWDLRHGWSTGGETTWNATWRDWSSSEVLALVPGVVVGLHADELARGVVDGELVPPDPACGDGRAVQWTVLVRENGGRRAYTLTGGDLVRGDWREEPEEKLEAVDWHGSEDIQWFLECVSYRAGFSPEYVRGDVVYRPRWEATELFGDTVVTASFDGRTGEPL